MRVQKKPGAATDKNGLANIMKLIIAVVFTITVALLNVTAKPQPEPVAVHLNDTAYAAAPSDTKQAPTPTPQPEPTKPAFDANDPSTWPTCAADEIVRADNGQCDKAATPEPAAPVAVNSTPARAAAPPVSGNAAKAFIYQKESGNRTDAINASSGACGLGQALPCSKMGCSLSDYACQDAWFTNYAMQRYGSWENAQAFWLANHWW